MKKSFSIKIPVRPHLKRYIQDFYLLPYELNQKDDLGLFLYHLLRRRKFRDRAYFSTESFTDYLEVSISNHYAFKQGCLLLNDYQSHLFNNYLEDMMMRHSITWIKAAEMAGMSNYAAIHKWIEIYQLDEGKSSKDWYHKIKKQYYRHRKGWKPQKTGVPTVP